MVSNRQHETFRKWIFELVIFMFLHDLANSYKNICSVATCVVQGSQLRGVLASLLLFHHIPESLSAIKQPNFWGFLTFMNTVFSTYMVSSLTWVLGPKHLPQPQYIIPFPPLKWHAVINSKELDRLLLVKI